MLYTPCALASRFSDYSLSLSSLPFLELHWLYSSRHVYINVFVLEQTLRNSRTTIITLHTFYLHISLTQGRVFLPILYHHLITTFFPSHHSVYYSSFALSYNGKSTSEYLTTTDPFHRGMPQKWLDSSDESLLRGAGMCSDKQNRVNG